MKVQKKKIDHIEKCYAVAEMRYDGKRHLLCSAEGKGPCRVYDLRGNVEETLWDGPGGVMTLQQLPDRREPILLATQGFFSPDDAAEGKLVYWYRKEEIWHCKTLCRMPFIHRFGIVGNEKEKYIIVATLKSANAYEGDWTCPGRIWTAKLPENIFAYDEEHPLVFQPLLSGLYKNHGFSINTEEEGSYAVVGTENGVYLIFPPKTSGAEWTYEKILNEPVSDMLYRDFDQDGEKELLVLSPFHGDIIKIYKQNHKKEFVPVYQREKKLSFAHAIWGGEIHGQEYAFLGGRGGTKELICLFYDKEKGKYEEVLLDTGAGAANCMLFQEEGQPKLLTANRETDEVALYVIEKIEK